MDYTSFDIQGKILKYVIIVFAVVIAVIMAIVQYNHKKNTYFTGHVVEKYVKRRSFLSYFTKRRRYAKRTRYYLIVETTENRDVKIEVPYYIYKEAMIGDSVEKNSGEIYPRIIPVSSEY